MIAEQGGGRGVRCKFDLLGPRGTSYWVKYSVRL